jgi:hypothetical protein
MTLMSSLCLAKVFFFSKYDINKSNIKQYSNSIFGVYIDYDFSGKIYNDLNNYCIIQKDSSPYIPIECKTKGDSKYMIDYIKMYIAINKENNTSCILNIYYYNADDSLIVQRPVNDLSKCAWSKIETASSIDEANQFLKKEYN